MGRHQGMLEARNGGGASPDLRLTGSRSRTSQLLRCRRTIALNHQLPRLAIFARQERPRFRLFGSPLLGVEIQAQFAAQRDVA